MSKIRNDCDGKKCDDTAIPCYFAKQLVFSLKGDIEEIKEDLVKKCDESFYRGILVSLQVLYHFDSPVQAIEIVGAAGGFKKVASYAEKSGFDIDIETLEWIKENDQDEESVA